jgi:hypothetical protein
MGTVKSILSYNEIVASPDIFNVVFIVPRLNFRDTALNQEMADSFRMHYSLITLALAVIYSLQLC